jgi:molybdenum cofactor cytidylyltransferase
VKKSQIQDLTPVQYPVRSTIPAVLLAAGRSSRMGVPKAALRLPGGDTFIARITRELTAGGAMPVLVVVSPNPPPHATAGPTLPDTVQYVFNPEPDRGQLSSLQCGLAAVREAPAVLVTLVDVPLAGRAVVRALIDAWTSSGASLIRPTRAGRHGHPMLIAPPLIDELLAADHSSSARAIVRRHAATSVELETAEDGPFLDVDTPEDYDRLIVSLTVDR